MQPTMNGPIAQLAAFGIIALVALFPSPQALRETVAPTPTAPKVIAPPEGPQAVRVALPSAPDALVFSPFPFDCLPQQHTAPLSALNECVVALDQFVASHEVELTAASDRFGGGTGPAIFPNPEVEEARRAVAVICRGKWSAGQLDTSPVADICTRYQ